MILITFLLYAAEEASPVNIPETTVYNLSPPEDLSEIIGDSSSNYSLKSEDLSQFNANPLGVGRLNLPRVASSIGSSIDYRLLDNDTPRSSGTIVSQNPLYDTEDEESNDSSPPSPNAATIAPMSEQSLIVGDAPDQLSPFIQNPPPYCMD